MHSRVTMPVCGRIRGARQPSGAGLCCAIGLILFWLGFTFPASAQEKPQTQTSKTRLVAMQGTVEVSLAGTQEWKAASAGQNLSVGDRLRTAKRSRAALELSDRSVLRVNESTVLHFLDAAASGKKASFELRTGSAYFFSRERPADIQFETPLAVGAIRGTEFLLQVAESGATMLALLDGAVELANAQGQVVLQSGERADVSPGQAPQKTALINANNIIQWCLYYPAILDPAELHLSGAEKELLAAALEAYRSGDLLRALEHLPGSEQLSSDSAKIFAAAVRLAFGQVEEAEALLEKVPGGPQVRALRRLMAAVQHTELPDDAPDKTASEWLARSYHLQSRSQLEAAREAARHATELSGNFGFAWVRLAELQFSFGRTDHALESLHKGLKLTPRNAQAHTLEGFFLVARNQVRAALRSFNQAIDLDPALGNAWLGRGLARLRLGELEEGRKDLQMAAALEPTRSEFRSYLGKAFHLEGSDGLADKELRLARKLDANDPTPWLYAALMHQRQNRINEAVRDLEQSQALNDNRSVFRSQSLLDQDRAMRSANLASIYKDAGLSDVSVREASRAVDYDYGNYSAHLFLANSYAFLRDPRGLNNRFESVEISELLVANLLAPVGAASLSQNRAVQDFSRLVEGKNLGVSSWTEYTSNGDWTQYGSQYGVFGNSAYAFDATYRSLVGFRPNNDFERMTLSAQVKQQLTDKDSVYLQGLYSESTAGDLRLLYDPSQLNSDIRIEEKHEPDALIGFHREWQPGLHTMLLAGRFESELSIIDPTVKPVFLVQRSPPRDLSIRRVGDVLPAPFARASSIELTSVELQQIWETPSLALIAGGRYQSGEVALNEQLDLGLNGLLTESFGEDLERADAYVYGQWQLLPKMRVIGGLSYSWLRHPANVDTVPATPGVTEIDQVSPKVGLLIEPWASTTLRVAYTRSLGGFSYDNSIRLEPTHVAGFNQAFRSIAPESALGIIPGSEFQTMGVAVDHSIKMRTFLVLGAEWLMSDADRTVGVLRNTNFIAAPKIKSSSDQRIEFEERSFLAGVSHLIGDSVSVGFRYRWSEAELNSQFPEVPATVMGAERLLQAEKARLHELALSGQFYLPSGLFGEFQSAFRAQSNDGYSPEIPGDRFWQHDVYLGYRFPRRAAEVRMGIRNLADHDYQLNPLNWSLELPRERLFVTSLRMNF
ncbi:MAG: FecR domain-containing protein [Verrucomicrobiota bacterium]